jgi:phosphohistidine swiveling domain-containing protein
LYNALLNGQLRRLGVDVAGFDVTDGLLELEEYDPKGHLARLKTQFDALGEDTRLAVREGDYAALSERPELIGFRADVVAFLERFGHLSDAGNDFSLPRWREDPDWVVRTIVAFEPREMGKRLGWEQLPLRWVQRALLGPLYGRARRFRLYREAMGSLFVYGLGIVRERVLAMGDKFVGRGLLDGPEDIFYLALNEIRTAVQEGDETGWMRTESAARKADMDACRDVVLPQTVYGDAPPPLEKPGHPGISLSGIPTSPGYYEGRVSVIRRLEESHKMEEGAVLVIPYSEVSWTPLFSKAGAVIAESGGILSHSSIVAREYGLPCVVSVAGACRLRDGTLVKVDGYQGTISVHTEEA